MLVFRIAASSPSASRYPRYRGGGADDSSSTRPQGRCWRAWRGCCGRRRRGPPACRRRPKRRCAASDLIYVATRRPQRRAERDQADLVLLRGRRQDLLHHLARQLEGEAHRRRQPALHLGGQRGRPLRRGHAPSASPTPRWSTAWAQAYAQKYWIAWLGFFKPRSDRVDGGQDERVSGDADAGGAAGEAVSQSAGEPVTRRAPVYGV